jgi:hypothetical protein
VPKSEVSCKRIRTIVKAAFIARSFGFGFSALGKGGGLAAVCGEAASGDREVGDGMMTGELVIKAGGWWRPGRRADIIALRCDE